MKRKAFCVSVAALLATITFWSAGCKEKSTAGNKLVIAVIPKGTMHEFWKAVEAGARDAEKEFGVTVIYKGPAKEDEKGDQIAVVDSFVSDKVSAIVLAPLDSAALVQPVRAAVEAKIPVIIIDSPLNGEPGKDFVSLVATDNTKGGYAAGEELAKAMGAGPKKVVLLRYMVGSASTEQREKGFLDAISKHPEIKVVSENQHAGASIDEAQTVSEGLLDILKQADGVFCPNESSTRGMLNALEANHLAGKITFVGFDASKPLIDAVKSGEIVALVAQNPRHMAYMGVKSAVQAIRGEKVPTNIDTGSAVITKANMQDPEIQKIIGQQ